MRVLGWMTAAGAMSAAVFACSDGAVTNDPAEPRVAWPGARVVVRFEGTEVRAKLELHRLTESIVGVWLAAPARSALVLASNTEEAAGIEPERRRVTRLAKPFDLDALLVAIDELVSEHAAPALLASP